MKVSLAIFFVLQVLDDFAAGQQYIMVSTDGPEQFPIIHARKSICVYFYKFVLNSTASLLNLSNETFTEDLQYVFVFQIRYTLASNFRTTRGKHFRTLLVDAFSAFLEIMYNRHMQFLCLAGNK
jgi:hypothetical protein